MPHSGLQKIIFCKEIAKKDSQQNTFGKEEISRKRTLQKILYYKWFLPEPPPHSSDRRPPRSGPPPPNNGPPTASRPSRIHQGGGVESETPRSSPIYRNFLISLACLSQKRHALNIFSAQSTRSIGREHPARSLIAVAAAPPAVGRPPQYYYYYCMGRACPPESLRLCGRICGPAGSVPQDYCFFWP